MSHKKSVTISMFLYLCLFLVAAFKFFILSLISAILIVSWNGFFMFLLLWVHRASWLCGFIVFSKFGKVLVITCSKTCLSPFMHVWHWIAYHSFVYFFCFCLSVCASFWIIFIPVSSSLLSFVLLCLVHDESHPMYFQILKIQCNFRYWIFHF